MNWAFGRPTKQSDTFKKQHSDKAVDGIYDAYFPSCAETKPGSRDRWWKTRLLYEIEVQEVVVTNRDDCCGKSQRKCRTLQSPAAILNDGCWIWHFQYVVHVVYWLAL